MEHDKPVDKLIAMYNECLYQLPPPEMDNIDKSRTFDASKYVPQTLKSAVKNVMGRFRTSSVTSETELGRSMTIVNAQVIHNVARYDFTYFKSYHHCSTVSAKNWEIILLINSKCFIC